MERPGLLEFGVYALVLAIVGGWVFALPPFTHEPGGRPRVAVVDSSAGASEGDGEAVTPVATRPQPQSGASASSAADPRPSLLVVTARSLNMRAEPNAGSALVGNYPRGAVVEKLETSGNWIHVRAEDDTTGWMYAGYLGAAED